MKRLPILLIAVLLLSGLLIGCEQTVTLTERTVEEHLAHTLRPVEEAMPICADGKSVRMGADGYVQEMLWCFEAENGYYRIRNDATGEYLQARDGNLSCKEVILTNECNERGLWKVYETEMKDVRIIGKLQDERTEGEKKYLSMSDGALRQGGEETAWELRPLTMRLNVYYDKAFADAYDKKGIYAVDALERILFENNSGAEDFCSVTEVLRERLGIRLSVNIIGDPYASYPYLMGCVHRDDPMTPCHNCFGTVVDGFDEIAYCQNGYHHKDGDHFIRSTPSSGTEFNLLFTGHAATCACDETSGGGVVHVDDKSSIYGRAEGLGTGNRVAVFLGAFGSVEDYEKIKFTVAHELMHLLDARHHAMKDRCIHGVTITSGATLWDVAEDHLLLPLCDACISRMNAGKLSVLYRHAP